MSKLVRTRLANKSPLNDLFANVEAAKDPETGEGFTEDELWAESRFLLIAGADTTSTALAGIFFYLTAYPQCLEKLATEIRTTFTSSSEIRSGKQMSSCQYLYACINEAMRMSPPISGTLWREVSTDHFILDGEHIPKGYIVGVSPYALHHNEELFPDSYSFKPERWIVSADNPKELVERARYMFSPFSVGTRACAGKNMAYMELTNTLAKTVWYLDFRRAAGPLGNVGGGKANATNGKHRANEFQLEEHITCNHKGPFLQFRVRKGMEGELSKACSIVGKIAA